MFVQSIADEEAEKKQDEDSAPDRTCGAPKGCPGIPATKVAALQSIVRRGTLDKRLSWAAYSIVKAVTNVALARTNRDESTG